MSDAAFYIADAKGFFAEENIDVELMPFKSGGEMISALGTGGLDVGGGGPNAGLYNALNRDVDLRIVADKGHILKEASYFALVVRKDLYESGAVTSAGDLRGRNVADYQESGTTAVALARLLETESLALADVKRTYLAGTAMIAALSNGSVDAGILAEPYITLAAEQGVGVVVAPSADVYPDQQGTVLMYGERFASSTPEVAEAFMRAYIKAARYYADSLEGGHLAGANSEEIADIVSQQTSIDPATIRTMAAQGLDPNGAVNVDSLESDLDFWRENGWIDSPDITAAQAVDTSFAEAAVTALGLYTPSP
jgi:NitT/TauT family transport system substrate-binding protein